MNSAETRKVVSVRAATRSDWLRIVELMAQTPMSASLPLVLQRSSDPDDAYPSIVPSFESQAGTASLGFVAEVAGDLAGYLHARVDQRAVWNDGALRPAPVLYVGDLRVASAHRRQGVAHALGSALMEEVQSRGITSAFTLVNSGNTAALGVLRAFPGVRATVLRSFTTSSRLIWRRPPPGAGRLTPISTESASLDALVACWRTRLFGPWIEPHELRSFLLARPEIELFALKGQVTPALALADPSRSRRLLFRRLPSQFRALRAVWNGMRFATGAPQFPGHGEPWRSVEVVLSDRRLLTSVLEPDLLALAHGEGAHALTLIESGLESSRKLRLSSPCYRLCTQLIALSFNCDLPQPPADLPAHVDLAFV